MKKQLPIIKEHFLANSLYKVTAFFVALAIWVTTLQGHKDFVHWRSYDVEVVVKTGYAAHIVGAKQINLHYSGPRSSTNKIQQFGQKLILNLMDEQPGKKNVEIRAADFNLPAGIRVITIEPKIIEVEIKESSDK